MMKQQTFGLDYMDDDGFIGCMPVDPRMSVLLMNPNEKIIRAHTLTFVYDYPLSREVRIRHTHKGGWTRAQLFRTIQRDYRNIYRTEEQDDCDPGHIPGMFNRATSNGRYGIWGHDIGDLVIEQVNYNPNTKTITLYIGS